MKKTAAIILSLLVCLWLLGTTALAARHSAGGAGAAGSGGAGAADQSVQGDASGSAETGDGATADVQAEADAQADTGAGQDADANSDAANDAGATGQEAKPADAGPARGEAGRTMGQQRRMEALTKVQAKLQSLVESGVIKNESALANLETVYANLANALALGTGAEQEADAAIESELEAQIEAGADSPAVLDLKAHAEARQGKLDEALNTMQERLQKNPNTLKAYSVAMDLASRLGQHQDLDTYVNGKKVQFDVRPFIEEGRTLTPVRFVAETLGADVQWDGTTRTVTITRAGSVIQLQIDSNQALINGLPVPLDVPAKIVGGRTVIPLRFVSEGFGLHVEWLGEHRGIVVTDEEPVQE